MVTDFPLYVIKNFLIDKKVKPLFLALCLMIFIGSNHAQGKGNNKWSDTQYPDYIAKMTDFRERADWSHDGKRILFVERSFGDVYEYNMETGKYKPLTHHYYHGGYVRALYLSNGDILLSGVKYFPGEDWRKARFSLGELDYSSGKPMIVNKKVVLDNKRAEVKNRVLEPQNFIPGREEELTVQASSYCEVFGLNLITWQKLEQTVILS